MCAVHFYRFRLYKPTNAQHFMLTIFLLITLVYVSMRKHHHQGVSLYAKLLSLLDISNFAYKESLSKLVYKETP